MVLVVGMALSANLILPQNLSSEGCRKGETNFGNLLTDAMREMTKADIAFVHAGILKETSLPAGEVEEENLLSFLLYPNEELVLLSLEGEKIKKALERSLLFYPKPSDGFLQISGISVIFAPSNPPGERVKEIKFGDKPLDPARSYKVCMPLSLAKGAEGYFRVSFPKAKMTKTGKKIGAFLIEYVKEKGAKAKVEGRIKASN